MKASTLLLIALCACALVVAFAAPHHAPKHHSKPAHHTAPAHHAVANGDHIRHAMVKEINSMKTSWTARANTRFQGKPIDAIKRQLGVKKNGKTKLPVRLHKNVKVQDIPTSFDSREEWSFCPSIKEVRDQSDCGSCWAFGAVEAATDRICIGTNGTVITHLSATDLLSCCTECGNGCDGGDPGAAWQYLSSTGVATGGNYNDFSYCVSYPFENCEHHNNHTTYPACPSLNGGTEYSTPNCPIACDSQSTYKTPYSNDKHVFSTAYQVGNTVEQIQTEIMTNGPVEAAFEVYADFEQYSSGVYQHVTGADLGGHAVKIIGWGVDEASQLPYWLIANSWNQDWGEKGFFRMLRGQDECGIEDDIVGGLWL